MFAPRIKTPAPRSGPQSNRTRTPKPPHRSFPTLGFPTAIQAKLEVGAIDDPLEHEADRIADEVLRMPSSAAALTAPPRISRKCADCESERELQPKTADPQTRPTSTASALVRQVLTSPGRPLDPAARAYFEPRFGRDFSHVRVHTDGEAGKSARTANALAYTVGREVVFGAGQWQPETHAGRRLIAHELAHVAQQGAPASAQTFMQRQPAPVRQGDVVIEVKHGGSGAPNAQKCGRPSWCPAGFCEPYRSQKVAEYHRFTNGGVLMNGISLAVDSRVVPLWKEYLDGGSSPKNLSADFGADFVNSPTTLKSTNFLRDELKASLAATPPSVPLFTATVIDLPSQIPAAIGALGDPTHLSRMNFDFPKDIPGNLAGDIGKDQTTCPAGAKPSPFNDERHASGKAVVARLSATELTVTPVIHFSVKDTIDLCPGNCGTFLEQLATVPFSQFEATGISGDVPFTVDFPAPFLGQFTVPAQLPAPPAPKSL